MINTMSIFKKTINIIVKMMVPFVMLALIIGIARLFLDLGAVFGSSSINTGFDLIVADVLSMFVVIELLKSIIEYFEIHRLRLTFIIDAALVFILREIMIGLYNHGLTPFQIISLSTLMLVLGVLRALGITLSPEKLKEAISNEQQVI